MRDKLSRCQPEKGIITLKLSSPDDFINLDCDGNSDSSNNDGDVMFSTSCDIIENEVFETVI